MSAWDEREQWCSRCGAEPGDPCVTVDGKRSSTHHGARVEAANRVWASEHRENPQAQVILDRYGR